MKRRFIFTAEKIIAIITPDHWKIFGWKMCRIAKQNHSCYSKNDFAIGGLLQMAPVCDSDGELYGPVVIEGHVIVFADSFSEAQLLLPGYLANFFTCFIIDDFDDDFLGFGIYADPDSIFGTRQPRIVRGNIVVVGNDFHRVQLGLVA